LRLEETTTERDLLNCKENLHETDVSDVHIFCSLLLILARAFWVNPKSPNEAPLNVTEAAPVEIVFDRNNELKNGKAIDNASDKDPETWPTDNATRFVLRRPLPPLHLTKESETQSVRSQAVINTLSANEFE